MGNTIDHFIWGYQQLFRFVQEQHSSAIFRSLDERFDPEVFVVGVRVDDRQDRYPACVEPEDDFWLASEALHSAIDRAKQILIGYPEGRILQTHFVAQQLQDDYLFRRALREAIARTICECTTRPKGIRYYASPPTKIDSFLVSLVLGLQEEVITSHHALHIAFAKIHEFRRFDVAVSLIDSAIAEYLDDVAAELSKPDPGAGLSSGKSRDEILRAAGNRLMMGAAYKSDRSLGQIGHWQSLFDSCNRIASLKYERQPAVGRAILAREDHPALNRHITFPRPVELQNARATRKLLQLSSPDYAIHMNPQHVFGLASAPDYTGVEEDLYEIIFRDHYRWEFAHAGQILMRVQSGQPSLPRPLFDPAQTAQYVRRIFRHVPVVAVDDLLAIIAEASREKHGTLLVISEDAESEASRLRDQGTPVEPRRLTPQLLKHLTPIDGAVLLDPNCTCYAIGVILDGPATEKGSSARGARFNSAARYVHAQPDRARVAVVVSEDGGIDLLPQLRPSIRRSIIECQLKELEMLSACATISRRRYLRIVDLLQKHRFYFLPEHCEHVNRIVAAIQERLAKQDPGATQISHEPFRPDPAFDPETYYDPE